MLDKNKALEVLKNNNLCILSTADLSGKSESAIMSLTTRNDLTLLMSTEGNSRKMGNIKQNPLVSVVVGGFKDDPSLQIEGVAKTLEDSEKDQAVKYMLSTHPELKDYGIESGVILEIKPSWARYIDYSQEPNMEEINL